jgi:hypothetical protein
MDRTPNHSLVGGLNYAGLTPLDCPRSWLVVGTPSSLYLLYDPRFHAGVSSLFFIFLFLFPIANLRYFIE